MENLRVQNLQVFELKQLKHIAQVVIELVAATLVLVLLGE